MGNHLRLALPQSGLFQPCSIVTHVAILTHVCKNVVLLTAVLLYPIVSGRYPFPLRLCNAVVVAVRYLFSALLLIYPPPPPFPSPHLSGP